MGGKKSGFFLLELSFSPVKSPESRVSATASSSAARSLRLLEVNSKAPEEFRPMPSSHVTLLALTFTLRTPSTTASQSMNL
jgi:hypothetical protein